MIINIAPSYSNSISVRLPEYEGFSNSGVIENPMYSGVRFGSDGKIYRSTRTGAWQWTGLSWLITGAASSYYLVREVVGGSALATDSGDLQQMNANLDFRISTTLVQKITTLNFSIADDTLGASILVSRTYQLDAQRNVDFEEGDEFSRPTWKRSEAR